MDQQDKSWRSPFFLNKQDDQNSAKANSAGSRNRSRKNSAFDDFDNQMYEKKIVLNQNIAKCSQQQKIDDQEMMNGSLIKEPQISFVDIDTYLVKTKIQLVKLKKVFKTILDYFQSLQVEQLTRYIRLIMQCSWLNKQIKAQVNTKQMCFVFQIIIFFKHMINKAFKNSTFLSILSEIFNTKSVFYDLNVAMQIFFDENCQQYYGQDEMDVFQVKKIFFEFKQSFSQIIELLGNFTFQTALYNHLAQFCINNMENLPKAKPKNAQIVKYLSNTNLFQNLNLIKVCSHLIELKQSQIKKQTKSQFQQYCKQILFFATGMVIYIENYVFPILDQLLLQQSSMDRKSQAIKMITQLVQAQKIYPETTKCVLTYIQNKNILEKFVNDKTHHQILKKFPPIIRFLYDQDQISTQKILKLVVESLTGHEQFLKIIQGITHYIKLSDLQQVFNILKKQKVKTNSHIARYFTNIISNFNLSPQINSKKKKNTSLKKNKNEYQAMEQEKIQVQLNHMQLDENSSLHKFLEKLFYFLLLLLQQHQNIYMEIFCRLISTQIQIILPFLKIQLINKLKTSHSYTIWILEHILKIQADKDDIEQKKVSSNSKINTFIHDLLAENLYECIYLILSRNRSDKLIVQKSISVIILLCRSFKALDKINVQHLWLILAKNGKDNSQREQFFQFLKQLLKWKNTLSQQAARYIFFQLFLKLQYQWFSIKIYDCFQMLFLRLNQDWKLLNYQNGSYVIQDIQLIGIQKLFYLYFCAESKVSKKIKDFLYKLTFYTNQLQIKEKLFKSYIFWIIEYLKKDQQSFAKNLRAKTESQYKIHANRAFQFFIKMVEVSKSNSDQNGQQNMILLNINNATKQAVPPLKKLIQVNKNIKLKDLRQIIKKSINPQLKQIKLVAKGSTLKLDNLSLKQLKIENKNTILVENIDIIPQELKNQTLNDKKQDQIKSEFISIFGQGYTAQFLQFVLEKYQGENLQKMCDIAMDSEKMKQLKIQFDQLQALQKEKSHSASNNIRIQEEELFITPKRFDELLSVEIPLLLKIINNQTSLIQTKHWSLIKKIPPNRQIWLHIEKQIQSEYPHWNNIFKHQTEATSFQIYNFFILKKVIELKNQTTIQFKQALLIPKIFDKKGLGSYIFKVLDQLIKDKSYDLELYTQIFSLLSLRIPNSQIILQCDLSKSLALQMFAKVHQIEQFSNKNKLNQNLVFPIKNVIKVLQIMQQNSLDTNLSSIFFIHCLLSLNYWSRQIKDKNKLQQLKLIQAFQQAKIIKLCCQYDEPFTIFYVCHLILNCQTFEDQRIFKKVYHDLKLLLLNTQKNSIIKQIQSGQKQNNLTTMSTFHPFVKSFHKVEWFFILLTFLIQISEVEGQQQYQMMIIKKIMSSFQSLTINQISGYFHILSYLIRANHIQNQKKIPLNQETSKESSKLIDHFGKWLFSNFIFQSNQLLMSQIMIKSNFFQLVKSISQVDNQKLYNICRNIINFGTEKRNSQNDNIDLRTKSFIGIKNLGSTCYINSLTQQLYHTKFSQLLLQSKDIGDNLFELKKTFAELYSTVKDVINIRPMINQVKFYGQEIIPTLQQDAQQFLMSLFNHIQSCGEKKLLDQVFGGSYYEELTYFQGQQSFKKYKTQQFYNITLDIKGKKNLTQALTYFSRYQVLDQKIYCQELNKKTSVGKKTFIQKFPNILIITLKRFQYDVSSQTRNKLNDPLQFIIDLDLNFISSKNIKNDKNFAHQQSQENKYKLCGVLVHSGSAESGHYYSFIKVGEKWYQFNDRHVSQINQTQKFKAQCFGSGQNKSKSAYILFYEKKSNQRKKMYHGISLSQISKQNFYFKKVEQQNKKFIKERFIFDEQYRKFVDYLIKRLNPKGKKNKNGQDSQQEQVLFQKLKDIEEIILPKNKVYYDSCQNKNEQFI